MNKLTLPVLLATSLIVGLVLGSSFAIIRAQDVVDCSVVVAPGEVKYVEVIGMSSLPTPPLPPTETPIPTDTPMPTALPTEMPTAQPTVVPSTETPIPTDTPIPTNTPTPTDTPQPSGEVWYGITRLSMSDWNTVATNLKPSVVELQVRESNTNAQIVSYLDQAWLRGWKVLLHIYVSGTNTNKPWSISNHQWTVSQRGREILQAVEGHSALWAVYTLHEPYDSSRYHADSDDQRALYTTLKAIANVPLYTDIAFLSASQNVSDGMCDYCGTFPTTFRDSMTSEQCIAESISRMDSYKAVQEQYMPSSELIYLINVYDIASSDRYRLPTAEELDAVRDHACSLGVSHLYYPWNHSSYDTELKDVPQLWSAIATGCGVIL